MSEAGWKQSAIWLPPKALARLAKLCKERDLTRQDMIIRLILEAETQTKKKSVSKKKTARSKAKITKKRSQAIAAPAFDDIGLARPDTFNDFPGAVSVNAAIKDLSRIDMKRKSRLDWRSQPRKFMAVREAQKHIRAFKKQHTDATINQRYKVEDKSIMEITATYTDDRPDHRVVFQARKNR